MAELTEKQTALIDAANLYARVANRHRIGASTREAADEAEAELEAAVAERATERAG